MKLSKLKKINILVIAALVVVATLGFLLLFGKAENEWQTKTLLYSFALKNTSHNMLSDIQFDVLLPRELEGNQQINSGSTTGDYQQDDVKKFKAKIPPYGSKVISFTLQIEKNNVPQSGDINIGDYLQETKYIEISNPAIQSLAKQLKAETAELTVNNIYNWLINNVRSENYLPENKGAMLTLQNLSGDCTELTYLFVALARANGIPARGVHGLYVPNSSLIVKPMDYHDWAEFYDGDNWILVDAQKQNFNSNYVSYLSIANFNDTNQNSKRFSVSDDSISVSFQ